MLALAAGVILGDAGHFHYICAMFVKKNRNRSGSISVQVLAKIGRSNRLIKTFGTSSDEREVSRLCEVARQWADEHSKSLGLFEYDGVERVRD